MIVGYDWWTETGGYIPNLVEEERCCPYHSTLDHAWYATTKPPMYVFVLYVPVRVWYNRFLVSRISFFRFRFLCFLSFSDHDKAARRWMKLPWATSRQILAHGRFMIELKSCMHACGSKNNYALYCCCTVCISRVAGRYIWSGVLAALLLCVLYVSHDTSKYLHEV